MKKFLSMVLTLAMAMSLVTFAAPAAGAKDFTDSGSIQYKEAVDVISAIQIMDGYNDASFGPTGTLTRGAAAKIICNMILGPTTASALPTNVAPFPDVPAGSTFAGYIAYCSEHNIISGYADGNFRPADSLSGYAFLKMLLCALGYDQEIEGYQGANWRVNVAKQALGIGMDDGLTGELDGSRIVTREEAALYAFNTLQSDMVEYDNKTTVAVNGATVTVGGNTFKTRTWATQSTRTGSISNRATTGGNIVQFAEEYFPQLVREPKKELDFTGQGDAFGRPSTKWTWKNIEVGTYKVNPAKTYYADTKVSDIYNDLGLAGTAKNTPVYVNGLQAFYIDVERSNGDKLFAKDDQTKVYVDFDDNENSDTYQKPVIALGNANPYISKAVGNNRTNAVLKDGTRLTFEQICDKIGDGTIIEVFHEDDTNKIVICAESVYPGEIDSTHARTSTKDAYVVVSEKGGPNTEDLNAFTKNGHDEFETDEAFEEEDKVWFTYSAADQEIGEVHKMTSLEGTLNRRVNEKSLTLDGTVYNYGEEYELDLAENDLSNSSNYVIFRDAQGYVLWVEEADFAVERYAVIQRISVEGSGNEVMFRYLDGSGDPIWGGAGTSWDGSRVRLLLSSGAERNFDLDESKRYRVANGAAGGLDDSVDSEGNDAPDTIKAIYDAGQVIRFTENNDGTVKLYEVTGNKTANSINNDDNGYDPFEIRNHDMKNLYRENSDGTYTKVVADADTIFVVKDPDGVKRHTGIKNAPDVQAKDTDSDGIMDTSVTAYAYISSNATKPTAKLVYVIVSDATTVKSSSKDITFLTHPSDPYVDDDRYFEYNAVIKGVIQSSPIRVYDYTPLEGAKANTDYDDDGNAPSVETGNDFRTGSIILNDTSYDTDDYLTSGTFSSRSTRSMVAQGIKKSSKSDEIKLDTHDGEHTDSIASNVNIFYVDGDGVIARITLSEIKNDTDDMVYYTVDESGDITNLFIVDYEDDDTYIASASIVDGAISFFWNTEDEDEIADNNEAIVNNAAWGRTVARALNMNGNIIEAWYDADEEMIVVKWYEDGEVQEDSFDVPTESAAIEEE